MISRNSYLCFFQLWRTEKVLGRGLCSSAIDYNRMNISQPRLVQPSHRKSACSESDVFKDIQQTHQTDFFANIRARMEASNKHNETSSSLEEQLINPPLLVNNKKSHFDYEEVRLNEQWRFFVFVTCALFLGI